MRFILLIGSMFSLLPVLSAQARSITYDEMINVLSDSNRNITSIDELLAQPEFTPEYLLNHTAVFQSRSLQYADPQNPRIIVYGEDAKLILAFTCAPGDCQSYQGTPPPQNIPSSDVLETIHWVDATKRFEFREITFPEKSSHGKVTISEANPEACMTCHQEVEPRPNWQPYFNWPGVYGGSDDGLGLLEGETQNLSDFLATAGLRPRYKHLAQLKEGYELRPNSRYKKEHNIDLTKAVDYLNLRRIAAKVVRNPSYEALRFAISLDVQMGTQLYDQGSHNYEHQVKAAGLPELSKLVTDCVNQTKNPPSTSFEFYPEATKLVRLFYALGEPSTSWFMSFNPKLNDEMIDPSNIDAMLMDELRSVDPLLGVNNDFGKQMDSAIAGWKLMDQSADFKAGLLKCALATLPASDKAHY